MFHKPIEVESNIISEGDMVIVYERHDRMKPVYVRKGEVLQNRFGVFRHNDWIGKSFGVKVTGSDGKGFVYLLAPTPELWTLVLPHRTQILYIADISTVISFLELKPGSVVLESGTGSGSMTHSLARTVAPHGKVFTFEFHQVRTAAAREEIIQHGLQDIVHVTLRDIEGEGFPEDLHGVADAVFLDLPGPHRVVPSAAACLRGDGVLCSFSPCIEQVQKTCLALEENGFKELKTVEILLRQYELEYPNICQLEEIEDPSGSDKDVAPESRKRTLSDMEQEANPQVDESSKDEAQAGQPADKADGRKGGKKQQNKSKHFKDQPRGPACSKPCAEARGHTSYLTFARLAV